MKRLAAHAALLLWLAAAAAAQESSDGRLLVRLHPISGSFSFHAIGAAHEVTPLLFEADPRTSAISVLDNDRIHRMGSGGGFNRSIEATQDAVSIRWRSATLEVEQRFITANGISGSAGGEIDVTNRSETARRVAVRYVLDTRLGERRQAHFTTADGREISAEYRFRPTADNNYWISADNQVSLFYLGAGETVSDAEAVVFANWKRLHDARWDYEISTERSFDLIPYSMNDSAAAVYYPSRTLQPGESYRVRFVVGTGESLARVAETPPPVSPPAPEPQMDSPRVERPRLTDQGAIEAEIDRVNALVRDINWRLSSERPLSSAEVAELRERLQELEGDQRPR